MASNSEERLDLIPPELRGASRSCLLVMLEQIGQDYRAHRTGKTESVRAAVRAYLDVGWRQDVPLWVARWARWLKLRPSYSSTGHVIGYFKGFRPAQPSGFEYRLIAIPEETTACWVAERVGDLLVAREEAKPKPPPAAPALYPPGDPGWLSGKQSLGRVHASGYLGVQPETVRKYIGWGFLEPDGKHVTVKSLRAYWRGKHPKKSGKKR